MVVEKNYNNSLKVRKYRGDRVGVSSLQNEVGNMYRAIGVTEMVQARTFYSESLRMRTLSLGCDKTALVTSFLNISQLLITQQLNESIFAKRILNEGKTLHRCDSIYKFEFHQLTASINCLFAVKLFAYVILMMIAISLQIAFMCLGY